MSPPPKKGGSTDASRFKSNQQSLRGEVPLVKRLPEKFTRTRHQFEQLCRTEDTAIYVQHIHGRQKAYEVIVIAVADRRPVKVDRRVIWTRCERYECYPGSEAWGGHGWTYTSEGDARAKYDLLNDPAFRVPAPPIYPIRAHAGFVQSALETAGRDNTAGASERRKQ